MMKALIIKTSSLGDIVQSFPVASYLKKQFPLACEVDWIVEQEHASLVKAFPDVDSVIPVSTRAWRKGKEWNALGVFYQTIRKKHYDVVFDLQGNLKSGLLSWFVDSKEKVGFSRRCVPEWPNLFFTNSRYTIPKGQNIRQDYLSLVQQWFRDELPFELETFRFQINSEEISLVEKLVAGVSHRRVMFCPGAAWKNKRLSDVCAEDLVRKIQSEKGGHVFLAWGTEGEHRLCQQLAAIDPCLATVVPRLPLPVLQNLMDRMDVVIAMDSLPLHLAGTTSADVVGIFGPSSMEKYRPLTPKFLGVQGHCPYQKVFEKRCPLLRSCSTGICMKGITADEICRLC